MIKKIMKDERGSSTLLFALGILFIAVIYITMTSDLAKIMTVKSILIKASIIAGQEGVKELDDGAINSGTITLNMTKTKQVVHDTIIKNIPSAWVSGTDVKYKSETVTVVNGELVVQPQVYLRLSKYSGDGRTITVTFPTLIGKI